MVTARRIAMLFSFASLLVVAASCVETKHPLSDKKNSKIDARLIGNWKEPDDGSIWKVTKDPKVPNTLVVVIPDAHGPIRTSALVTTIKSKGYLSCLDSDGSDEKDKEATYNIFQYVFIDKDTVEIRGMEAEVIAKAIARKEITGQIVKKEPIITDTPAGIARYLESHADECFPAKTNCLLTLTRQK
jgi:hypothetical protein